MLVCDCVSSAGSALMSLNTVGVRVARVINVIGD